MHRTDNPDYLRFCELGNTHYGELELWGIAIHGGRFGQMVAHDAVEHTEEQLTATYTSVTEEYKAIGATMLCRWENGYDLIQEADSLKDYPQPTLKGIDEINTDFYALDDVFVDIEDGEYTEAQQAAVHYINEGRARVDKIFNGDRNKASSAFKFIEHNAESIPAMFGDNLYLYSVEITADTDKKIWRVKENSEEYFDEEE